VRKTKLAFAQNVENVVKQKNTVNVWIQIFIAPLEANVMQNKLQGSERSISSLNVK